ncbi:MAG TPA: hypothetical protein VLO11_02550 [Luteolibacter sp.]|nr:hypothetical protein [Luteolibacter sp.]
MYRIVVILSLLPIVVAMIACWWFGRRILASLGRQDCRCDLARWTPPADAESDVRRASGTAAGFGLDLRAAALVSWREEEPKAAAARENTRRFGAAVPPLATMVAVFALLVGKLPAMGVFAALFAATALAAAMSLLGLPAELRAIARHARQIRERRAFPDRDHEQAVIDCAIAHAWSAALPSVLRWLGK